MRPITFIILAVFMQTQLFGLNSFYKLELPSELKVGETFECSFNQEHLVNIIMPPNLLIDINATDTTPGGDEIFNYRYRYRCASITENCTNAQITFEIPDALDIISLPAPNGNIKSVIQTPVMGGIQVVVELESPPSENLGTGVLRAGSSGIFTVLLRFKCEDEAGVNAGSTLSLSDAVFSVSNGGGLSVNASSPDLTVPILSTCTPPVDPPSPNFSKAVNNNTTGAGEFVQYVVNLATTPTTQVIEDEMPLGILSINASVTNPNIQVEQLEINCGSGFQTILSTANGDPQNELNNISAYLDQLAIGGAVAGTPILNTSGNPTGCTFEVIPIDQGTDRIIAAPVGQTLTYRHTVDISGGTPFIVYQGIIDHDMQTDVCLVNNAENLTIGESAGVETCITDKPIAVGSSSIDQTNGLGSTQLSANPATNLPSLTKAPEDLQLAMAYTLNQSQSAADLVGPRFTILLPEGWDFIEGGALPNYQYATANSFVTDVDCFTANFTRTPNYNGTNRTFLEWELPDCSITEIDQPTFGDEAQVFVFFSVRYMGTAPLQIVNGNQILFSDMIASTVSNQEYINRNTGDCVTRQGIGRFYTINSPSGSVNSEKFVKGILDTDFSRYPQFGQTELTGEGEYEFFIYNHGFPGITRLDVVDILPHLNDLGLLDAQLRESEWNAQLASVVTVERFKAGQGLLDATSNLGASGIQYSVSTNPCFLDDTPVNNGQVTFPGGTEGSLASCDVFSAATPAIGARSFAFQWENTGDPLLFGEYLKFTVDIEALAGNPDISHDEIAWNSFAFTAYQDGLGALFSSEPIKVGIRAIDTGVTAAIGNFVWEDTNYNGLQDAGESAFEGITVSLYDGLGNPVTETVTVNGVTTVVPITSLTDANGEYCFAGLAPNTNYILRLDNTQDFTGGANLDGFTLTTANANTNASDELDSDAVLGNSVADPNGDFPEVTAFSPNAGEEDKSFDFGFVKFSSIGDFVFEDLNSDGIQDASEPGIQGVTVELIRQDNSLFGTETTNVNGTYLFEDVPPGTYFIRFSTPAGLVSTFAGVGGDTERDSDINSDGETDFFVVATCDFIRDKDAGFRSPPTNPASIAGSVVDDLAKNMQVDALDPGISGIEVQLLDEFGFLLESTLTDINGDFLFENLDAAVNYIVQFIPPSVEVTYTFVEESGTAVTGLTGVIDVADNENRTGVDAGLCGLMSIGNRVFLDNDNNGMLGANETGISNVELVLVAQSDGIVIDGITYNTGDEIGTTFTDVNGRYVFNLLPSGTYRVEAVAPGNNLISSTDIASTPTPNQIDSDDNGIGIAGTGRILSSNIVLDIGNVGNPGDPNWIETDDGIFINGSLDPTSNPKAYYTVDFGFRMTPPCIPPSVTNIISIIGTCTSNTPNNDATINLTGVTGDQANFSTGSSYTGPAYGDMSNIDVSSGSGMIMGLMHNTQYTVRVWNGANDCYVDETVMTPINTCSDCNCKDFIYLNDVDFDVVHKFEVNETTGALTEIGSPWNDLNENWDPHGVGIDLNGRLYIAETINGNIRQLDCNGNVLNTSFITNPSGSHDLLTSNFGTHEGYIYTMNNNGEEIRAFDLCNGSYVGAMHIDAGNNRRGWGFYIDENNWYVSARAGNGIYNGSLDISLFTDPATNSGARTFSTFINNPMGLTRDELGNFYVIRNQDFTATGASPEIVKFSPTGVELASQTDNNNGGSNTSNGEADFWGARGIVYSEASSLLYVSGFENCVTVFDTDLIQQTTLNIGNPLNGEAKGIGLVRECCPTTTPLNYTETICSNGTGERVFLQDIFSCGDGIICEGQWSVETANANQVFNSCDLSITINGSGCGTYVLEKTTPASGNQQCNPFRIELEVCTEVPSATANANQGTCTSSTPNNDATIILTSVTGDQANYSTGASYTGPAYDDASNVDVSGGSGILTGLIHNTQYTVRIFNSTNECFVDQTVMTPGIGCGSEPCIGDYVLDFTDPNWNGGSGFIEGSDPSTGLPFATTQSIVNYAGTGLNVTVDFDGMVNTAGGEFTSPNIYDDNDWLAPYNDGLRWVTDNTTGNAQENSVIITFSAPIDLFALYNLKLSQRNVTGGPVYEQARFELFDGPNGTGNRIAIPGGTAAVSSIIPVPSAGTYTTDLPDLNYTNDILSLTANNTTNQGAQITFNGIQIRSIIWHLSYVDGAGNFSDLWRSSQAIDNICFSPSCTLSDIGKTLETCNNNGTGTDPSDDYLTFSLNPIGSDLGSTYSVTVNNGGTVTQQAGGAANGISYGSATAFRLQDGSADGSTTYTITVTDDIDVSCQATTTVMQSTCSTDCNLSITQSTQSVCQDNGTTTLNTDDYFTISVNATVANGSAQYQAVLNANPDGTAGTILGTASYGQSLILGNGINGAIGTFLADGITTYTITLRDATNNTCHNEFTTSIVNPCNSCPSISNPSSAQAICDGQTTSILSINTDATTSNVEFVYFSTPQTGNAAYSGGTSLATVTPISGMASISNVVLPGTGDYYIYAILTPTPIDVLCRPFQEIQVTVNRLPDINLMVSDPNICDGEPAPVIIFMSEVGVTYQLRNDIDNSPIGSPIAGTGGDITLSIEGLSPNNYVYNILATVGATGCQAELIDRSNVTINECDFPDFPSPNCDMPVCHIIPMTPLVYFGAGVTADPPGNGTPNANTDLDDGIGFPNNIRRNITIRLPITFFNNTGNPVYIRGWIDWDGDSNFGVDEQVAHLTIPFDGTNLTQTISHQTIVPPDAIQNNATAMRWRISSDPIIINDPCGNGTCATDGEVEDYLIQVECPPEQCLTPQMTILRN